MATYTIQAVAAQTKDFESKFGPMRSYKVKFTNDDRAIELTQKASSPAPQAGGTLDGHIEDGQYGPKFKKEYAQAGFGGGAKPAQAPRDDSHIKAQWAIGQSITLNHARGKEFLTDGNIEGVAKTLFAMVDRVKAGEAVALNETVEDIFGGSTSEPPETDPFEGLL